MAGISNPHRSETADRLFKEPEYKLENNQAVKYSDVCVHEFRMGDVEDPDLYAAQPLSDWQNSESGAWVMAHAVDVPFWHRVPDPHSYGFKYLIIARLSEPDQLFWTLKYRGNQL
jgi:hypothetical protein